MIGQAPAFSVSGFVAVFNQSLDMLYPEVVITGELANFRTSKNMWVYFDLKDESASVKFFGTVRALPGPLEDGMLLEVIGRPYLHPQFGFSIQISGVEAVGTGSINKVFLLLQKQLEKEGLFDASRKRQLPYAPEKIGLIASKESAAYGDFIKVLSARWPMTEVKLFNVLVQGREAAGQIVNAIEQANQGSDLEVLVMIRGGGSKDDLASFDHEAVVRAVAASRTPTLVAIGHERDVALSEMAADARASTPSSAAEFLVPDRKSELDSIKSASLYLDNLVSNYSSEMKRDIAEYAGQIDRIVLGLYDEAVQFAGFTGKLLYAYDPRQPLEKGYALVRNNSGKLVKSTKDAKIARTFSLEFRDGTINAAERS